jgi:hypothetical protein
MPGCDFSFDFHSGGSSLMYIPSALCTRIDDAEAVRTRDRAHEGLRRADLATSPRRRRARTARSAPARMRQGIEIMGTELGGSGKVTPAALKVAETASSACSSMSACSRPSCAPPPPSRVLEVGGAEYFVYAPTTACSSRSPSSATWSRRASRRRAIHYTATPWRQPSIARFEHHGTVLCMRVPGADAARRLPLPPRHRLEGLTRPFYFYRPPATRSTVPVT